MSEVRNEVRNYDFPEAAERLGCKERWLHENFRRLGYYQQFGREISFDDLDLAGIKEKCRIRPTRTADTPDSPTPSVTQLADVRPSGRSRTRTG